MRSKKSLFCIIIALAVAVSFLLIQAETSLAKSMTLKVSHQFARGDVRDQMVGYLVKWSPNAPMAK